MVATGKYTAETGVRYPGVGNFLHGGVPVVAAVWIVLVDHVGTNVDDGGC